MSDGRNANFAGNMSVCQRHEDGAALMGRRNKPTAAIADKTVDHEQIGVAHQSKHRIDPVLAYRAGNGLKNIHLVAHSYCSR